MSVYTSVSIAELEEFLSAYAVGRYQDLEGIPDGIENTNYFLTTDEDRFVLTLFEQATADELPFCLEFMAFLADHNIPSAHPVADRRGQYVQRLNGKPAVLVRRLRGASVEIPAAEHCRAIGAALGRAHTLGQSFSATRENERGSAWHEQTAQLIRDRLSVEKQLFLDALLSDRTHFGALELPQGVIHADLFRDNALFEDRLLTGLIDFYYAHTGPLIYDLAVTVSDWCFDEDAKFNAVNARILLDAYSTERVPTLTERNAWLASLRAAGLRFWLSRTKDQLFVRHGAITQTKSPAKFEAIIRACGHDRELLQSIWH